MPRTVDPVAVGKAIGEALGKALAYAEAADQLRYQADDLDRLAADERARADEIRRQFDGEVEA